MRGARLAVFVAVAGVIQACGGADAQPAYDGSDDEALTDAPRFDVCAPGARCPDLRLDAPTVKASIVIETRDIAEDSCSVAEGTILASGRRRLLRFTTFVTNVGTKDLFLGDPSKGNARFFEFASCHGHFHFKGYADYELKARDGTQAAKGHKESFCIEDNVQGGGRSLLPRPPQRPFGSPPVPDTWTPKMQTNCHHPGLHRGWGDGYVNTTEGNWIDITDVPAGDYVLSVTVNPDRMIAELHYDDNHADVAVHIPPPEGDGTVCPAELDAIYRCVDHGARRSKCFQGVTTTQRCPTQCVQLEEIAHPAQCH